MKKATALFFLSCFILSSTLQAGYNNAGLIAQTYGEQPDRCYYYYYPGCCEHCFYDSVERERDHDQDGSSWPGRQVSFISEFTTPPWLQ